MTQSKLTINLDPIVEKAFELTKIKDGYDLKGKISLLQTGVFKVRLKEILNMTKVIFETYDQIAKASSTTSGKLLVPMQIPQLEKAVAGDDKSAPGLKKFIGSFLYRNEITKGSIDEHAISQFLSIAINLIAAEVSGLKDIDNLGIANQYKPYTNIESLKEEILTYVNQRLL